MPFGIVIKGGVMKKDVSNTDVQSNILEEQNDHRTDVAIKWISLITLIVLIVLFFILD
jgi:hypothetical protein